MAKTKKRGKTALAWHFLREDGRLNWPLPNGTNPKVEKGQKLTVPEGSLELCEFGLHASRNVMDALAFQRGPIVCRVRVSGRILEDDDKLCASERTVLWHADATGVLRRFTYWCIYRALGHAADALDKAGLSEHAAKLRAIPEPTSEADCRAASNAANAARCATNAANAARCATYAVYAVYAADYAADCATYAANAAYSAADAAYYADRSASYAASYAASSASYAAERKAQEKKLRAMLMTLRGK